MSDTSPCQSRRFDPNTYPLTAGVRLLEASAGTGKTFALAHLVLRLIGERGLRLDQLLVVTFTEAAADELRDRIGRRLDAALQGLQSVEQGETEPMAPDAVLHDWLVDHSRESKGRRELASRLLEALESLERADITTIHGFCRRSLRRQALQSGQTLELNVDDDPQGLVREVAHDYWREQILSLEAGDVAGLIQAGLTVETLCTALQRLDGDCDVRIAEDAEPIEADVPLGEAFRAWMQPRWERFHALWQAQGAELEASLRACAEDWRSRGCKDTKPYSPRPTKDRSQAVNAWLNQSNDTVSLPPRYIDVLNQEVLGNFYHPGTFSRTARRCVENDPSLPVPALQEAIAALWDGPAEQTWRHALRWGRREIAGRRSRRGVIGFSGLLDALDPGDDSHAPWLPPLRERYRVALIDEFQDTDPLQWRLLRTAFATPDHLLLMVGDPKQAIYRFRGGDLNTYKAARAEAERIDDLLDNRRTTPALMQAMNQLMAPGLALSQLPVPEVRACATAEPLNRPEGIASLQILEINADDPDGASSRTELEGRIPRVTADLILRLLANDPNLDPADICILVSRHLQAEAVRDQLARAGLPSRLVSQGDVLTSKGSAELQTFLDALAQPGDTSRLRLLAVSALLQWGGDGLAASEENGRLDQLAARIQELAAALPRLGLMGCLARLLEGQTVADLSSRGRLLGDIQQAARLVQDTMHRQGLDGASGADWLRRQRLHPPASIPDHRQPYSDLATSAVAVVTVHRSKGLQYPVVLCPYLWQAPSPGKGPLWRTPPGDGSGRWRVALNPHWGRGFAASSFDALESKGEAERLAYVAITRAERHLVLFWGRAAQQEGNPLEPWLQSFDTGGHPLISRQTPEPPSGSGRWHPQPERRRLRLGPVPSHPFDRSWGRSSYSAWIAGHRNDHMGGSQDPRSLEEGRDVDEQAVDVEAVDVEAVDVDLPLDESPLGTFPRGAAAGDCLHRILEQIPFDEAIQQEGNRLLVERELNRSGLDVSLTEAVLSGMATLLGAPLGGPLQQLRLADLHSGRRRHELSFDLPVAHQGKAIQASGLARTFRVDPDHRFGPAYADHLEHLDINSRGFLTGSIDLVFTDGEDPATARWWVADWKSNWIGERDGDGKPLRCGPQHYTQAAMEEQMLMHHYPLQAHLYLVALHRFLQWRLDGYEPERHLGGYVYVFLRGVSSRGGTGLIIEPTPLQRLEKLDQLLSGGLS